MDGFWYAVGKDQALKSRPYEATLPVPGGYLLFSLADLRCVVDRSQFASATQDGRQGSILSYRIPLPPENRRALEQMVSEMDSLGGKDPKFLERPDVADMLKLVRDQVAKGAPLRMDEANGIVVEFKLRDMLVTVSIESILQGK